MTGNILELITEQYHSLTRSSRKLADYILANTHDSQYMSISSLAENCGVSEASITRFCRSLGLSGYNNLKLALAKAAYVTDIGDPSDTPETITSEDTLNSIFHKLYDSNVLSLNETMELLDETEISRAVDLISSADRVFCLGNGGSMVMAMVLLLLRLHQGHGGYHAHRCGTACLRCAGHTFSKFARNQIRGCHPSVWLQRKPAAVRFCCREAGAALYHRMPVLCILQAQP